MWCNGHLTKHDHSIDHFDGNIDNDAPDNLLASCVGCNSKRAENYPSQAAANADFDAYLRDKGSNLLAATRRREKQLATPIPHGNARKILVDGTGQFATREDFENPKKRKQLGIQERIVVNVWCPDDNEIDEIIHEFLPGGEKYEARLDYVRRTGIERARASRERAKENEPREPQDRRRARAIEDAARRTADDEIPF